MTPNQHGTAADAHISRLDGSTPAGTKGTDADQLLGEAHAILAGAIGTGTHYVDADAALAVGDASSTYFTRLERGRLAVMHAHLAGW